MAKLATLHVTISARVNDPPPPLPSLEEIVRPIADSFAAQMAEVDRVMREPLPDISGLGEAIEEDTHATD